MTVTPDILIEHGVTGTSEVLNRLIAAAVADIESRYGTSGAQVDDFLWAYGTRRLWTRAIIKDVTKVEHGPDFKTGSLVELTATEYRIAMNNRAIEKIEGTFDSVARVTYNSKSDEAQRDIVVIELVKLEQRYNGTDGASSVGGALTSKAIGGLRETYSAGGNAANFSYNNERERLMMSLAPGYRLMA